MRSNGMRVFAGIAVVVVAVVLLIVLGDGGSDDGGETTTNGSAPAGNESAGGNQGGTGGDEGADSGSGAQAAVPTVIVQNGKPVGGVRSLSYKEGDQIRFTVESDVSDEVHVHGYDVSKDIEAGGSVDFAFPAEIEGIFEVELEGRRVPLAEITVNP